MASIPQRSAQGIAQPQVFPLSKFSYATCSTDLRSPINWTHLPDRDNLHAVFDHVRVQTTSCQVSEKTVLKVVRGPEIMEELDLNSLAQEAISGEKLNAVNDPSFLPPVLVIFRPPCIAIRYPLPTRQSRRFQMRFQTDPDYYKALTVLSEAGFPLKQASTTTPGARPTSSMRPRPLTSSSINEVKKLERQSSYTIQNIPPAIGSQIYGYNPGIGVAIPPLICGQTLPEFLKPTSSSSSTTINSAAVPLLPKPILTSTDTSSTPLSPTNGYLQGSTNCATNKSFDEFLDSEMGQRPATAPTDDLTISQCMPPRRELPFDRLPPHPTSKTGNQNSHIKMWHTSVLQNDLSVMRMDGGKKQGPQTTKARKQAKSFVPSVEDLLKIPTLPPAPPIQRRHVEITKSSLDEAAAEASDLSNSSRKRSLPEPEGQFEPFNKRSATNYKDHVDFQPSGALSTSKSKSALPLRDSTSNPNAANALRRALHSHPSSSPAVAIDPWGDAEMDLDAFVARSPNGRQAEIENWICRQLLDPNFKTLCEEVESCWKRVFLGEG